MKEQYFFDAWVATDGTNPHFLAYASKDESGNIILAEVEEACGNLEKRTIPESVKQGLVGVEGVWILADLESMVQNVEYSLN